MIEIRHGNCLDVLTVAARAGERFHSVVADPPYHLTSIQKRFGKTGSAPAQHGRDGSFARLSKGFMGKTWDGGDVAFRPETWRRVWDVLHPGAHMTVFGGSRTFHRMAVAIEDAGFEIRDTLFWLYGTGFPKSHDVSKGIDRALGAEPGPSSYKPNYANNVMGRGFGGGITTETAPAATEEGATWAGWGTALKPAYEPVLLVRKPLDGTVAQNVLAHGCGGVNIGGCRVPMEAGRAEYIEERLKGFREARSLGGTGSAGERVVYGGGNPDHDRVEYDPTKGRWPPNILHDGSPEVLEAFGRFGDRPGGAFPAARGPGGVSTSGHKGQTGLAGRRTPGGTAARFFPALGFTDEDARFHYSGKATRAERIGSKHPTVKPIALLRWLVRLITPPGGRVLDPFAGTGTTGAAARAEGLGFTGVEMTDEYVDDCLRRLPEALLDKGPWGLDLGSALARNRAARLALEELVK